MKLIAVVHDALIRHEDRGGLPLWFTIANCIAEYADSQELSAPELEEVEAERYAFRMLTVPAEKRASFVYSLPEFIWVAPGTEILPPTPSRKIIEYWRRRSQNETCALLRARYADIVWDLERFVEPCTAQRDFRIGFVASDSYLEAARNGGEAHPIRVLELLDRALDISATLRSEMRVESIINEFLVQCEKARDKGHTGVWLHVAKTLLPHKSLSTEQRERLRIEFERRFEAATNEGDKFSADIAIPHLLRLYQRTVNLPEKHAVLRKYAAMHRRLAVVESSAMIAVSSLLGVVELLEDNALQEEADALRFLAEDIGPRVEDEMSAHSFEHTMPKEEVDSYFDELLRGDNPFVAMFRLAIATRPKVSEVKQRLDRMREETPLQFLFSRVGYGNSGLPVTQTGSADQEPDAHLSMQYGMELSMSGTFFLLGFRRVVNKFNLDKDSLLNAIRATPLIRTDRMAFFSLGFEAHFSSDYFKSIHIFVPQIENMLRELLRFLHLPRSKRVRGQPGVTELKTMGDVLRDSRIVDILDEDLRWFLTHLLIEKHGFNIRNDLSHGIAPLGSFNEMMSAQILQSIIMLCAISEENIYLESPRKET